MKVKPIQYVLKRQVRGQAPAYMGFNTDLERFQISVWESFNRNRSPWLLGPHLPLPEGARLANPKLHTGYGASHAHP